MEIVDKKMSNIDNSSFLTYYTYQPFEPTNYPVMTIVMAGDEQCASTYRMSRTVADISVLICILQGEGFVQVDGKEVLVKKGDVFTLPCGTLHKYRASNKNPWRIAWFNLSGDFYPLLLQQYSLHSKSIYTQVSSDISEKFQQGLDICKLKGDRDKIQDLLCTTVFEIILLLWRQLCVHVEDNSIARYVCNEIDRLISQEPFIKFSVDSVAEKYSLSARQLERLFKEQYGITPYQYYQKRKITIAKQYLDNTMLSVKELSYKLGYCDQYYFSNCFKAVTGISPKSYRHRSK